MKLVLAPENKNAMEQKSIAGSGQAKNWAATGTKS